MGIKDTNTEGHDDVRPAEQTRRATSIDWYSEGETRVVEASGVRVVVRFVGRKGRRGRIVIEAPAGATFSSFSEGAELTNANE